MKAINPTLVLMSLGITTGILLSQYINLKWNFSILLIATIALLFFIWRLDKVVTIPNGIFPFVTFLSITLIGICHFQFQKESVQECHFEEIISSKTTNRYQVKITEVLKPSRYDFKYLAELHYVDGKTTCGKILLKLKRDSLAPSLKMDEEWLLMGTLTHIPNPLNPSTFNYQKYMKNLGVFGQFEINKDALIACENGESTLQGNAEILRQYLLSKLRRTQLKQRERSILEAMVLGNRKEIDPILYKEYAASGAVHILAVSGLHVGILLLLLNGLSLPLRRIKLGRLLQPLLVIAILWGYAYLVGLSSSVVRSVTMFSFLAFSRLINRPSAGINLLILSYFFMLLIQPKELFQVGFQMSYLAVFFILWVYPYLMKLVQPKIWLLKKLWQITAVSLAAQIGVAPLSIYYFHQFPGVFLLTNLLIIPFLGILLSYGITVISLAAMDLHVIVLEKGLQKLVFLLNEWIIFNSQNEWLILKDLSLPFPKLLVFYGIIFLLLKIIIEQPRKLLLGILGSFVMWSCMDLWQMSQTKNSLVIFQKYRKSLIAVSDTEKTILYQRDTANHLLQYPVKDYLIAFPTKEIDIEKMPSVFKYELNYFNVIDSSGVYTTKKNAILIFTESPKINLDRLIDSITPKLIIADGSNYNSYINRWKKTCEIKGTPFYDTKEKGAYMMRTSKKSL